MKTHNNNESERNPQVTWGDFIPVVILMAEEKKHKYIVEYDRANCIGAEMCAFIDPGNFRMNEDGKADLVNGEGRGGEQFALLTSENIEDMGNPLRRAADSCPAAVIRITEIDTGKRVAGAPPRK